ncbi:ATP synthase mitochondrial F1 complex assembly factor 1-like [Watersipora subatra]|uniref:ATP synthase mitochondrial F1 complex assembly factor 1-like n=1 Tax=Watersipora subatra TaxID=2589382 RepID=UPI00355C395D
MANVNLSDMLARKLIKSALRSTSTSGISPAPRYSLTAAQIVNLSTFDRPAAVSLEENEYFLKYKDKLEKIKHTKPREYEAAIKKIYGDKTAKGDKSVETKELSSDVTQSSILSRMQASSKVNDPVQSSSKRSPQNRCLDSIIKLELLHGKSASEIQEIWNEYYSKKEGTVFATIPVEKYKRLKSKGQEFPLFIYPLPRESGYEFMLGQCSEDDWYYTPLIAYQTHGEYAPFSLTIQYYTELAESKGIVLMVGEIASQDLKPEHATILVHQTQLMYGSDENLALVRLMNEKPDEFQHMDVINTCKKAGLF